MYDVSRLLGFCLFVCCCVVVLFCFCFVLFFVLLFYECVCMFFFLQNGNFVTHGDGGRWRMVVVNKNPNNQQ